MLPTRLMRSIRHSLKNTLSNNNHYRVSIYLRCLSDVQYNRLEVYPTTSPRVKPTNSRKLVFGENMSDHMLVIDWTDSDGWAAPKIVPFGPLAIPPAASSLHYGLEVFEGMKAYRCEDGGVQLFRPSSHMQRFSRSSGRLSLPTFNQNEVLKCITELVRIDQEWINYQDNCSLYIRPSVISTEASLGVKPPSSASLFVITAPVGSHFRSGFPDNPLSLLADPKFVRAWPGGIGDCKAGGNYGPTIHAQRIAHSKGCSECLWLYKDQVTEMGSMNLFMYWINEEGVEELITPDLNGLILPGITRDSLLTIAKEWGEFKVTEKSWTMQQLEKAVKEERVKEVFGAGTARVVCPVDKILWKGEFMDVGCSKTGFPLAQRLFKELTDIQYGRKPHPWRYLVDTPKVDVAHQCL